MFYLANPGILAAGGSRAKTYPEFVAHIAGISSSTYTWTGPLSSGGSGWKRTKATGTVSGVLRGSPWGPSATEGWVQLFDTTDTTINSAMRHALPTEAEWNAQRAGSLEMAFKISPYETLETSYSAVTRNGLTSVRTYNAGIWTATKVEEVLAWIDGQPMRMRPSLGLGPDPYDW